MNIFALSTNPREAAKWHVDKHVVKMPLETAQILCTVRRVYYNDENTPYRNTRELWKLQIVWEYLRDKMLLNDEEPNKNEFLN